MEILTFYLTGEPSLEDKAALLVESLSLGVDAEETATTAAPTQSSRRLQFRFPYFLNRFKKSSYYYRFRSMSALSTDNTCPADGTSQADNTICEDICTRNGELVVFSLAGIWPV